MFAVQRGVNDLGEHLDFPMTFCRTVSVSKRTVGPSRHRRTPATSSRPLEIAVRGESELCVRVYGSPRHQLIHLDVVHGEVGFAELVLVVSLDQSR